MTLLIETNRLIVRQTQEEDLENYISLHLSHDVQSLMYMRAKSVEEVAHWLKASIQHQAQYGFSVGTVFEKSSGDFIGRAGLVHVGETDDVEIDCYLLKPYWRKGYGLELLRAFIKWGFINHSLRKIVAIIYPINTPSKLLAERAGMKFIGIRKHNGVNFMFYEINNGVTELLQKNTFN